jgi:signal transduction histidine kinase
VARRAPRPAPAELTALVGHELSTPIATALLYLRIAECHCARPDGPSGLARSAVSVACAELDRLKRLVDRVLEVERLGRAVVRPQNVDLGAVVRGAVERALGAIADAVLRDTVTVLGPASFVGWWDEIAVEQIVRNLLSNALKFGEGRPIRVVLEATTDGATISVRDGGVGIRAGERERIFERRVSAPVSAGGGLGLGLWLVRELAVAHGGAAAVDSRPGQGATFRVELPELSPAGAYEPALPVRVGRRRSRPDLAAAAAARVAAFLVPASVRESVREPRAGRGPRASGSVRG